MAGTEFHVYMPWPASADGVPGCAGRTPANQELLAMYREAVRRRDRFLILQIVSNNPTASFDAAFLRYGSVRQEWIVKLLKDGP